MIKKIKEKEISFYSPHSGSPHVSLAILRPYSYNHSRGTNLEANEASVFIPVQSLLSLQSFLFYQSCGSMAVNKPPTAARSGRCNAEWVRQRGGGTTLMAVNRPLDGGSEWARGAEGALRLSGYNGMEWVHRHGGRTTV